MIDGAKNVKSWCRLNLFKCSRCRNFEFNWKLANLNSLRKKFDKFGHALNKHSDHLLQFWIEYQKVIFLQTKQSSHPLSIPQQEIVPYFGLIFNLHND